MNKLLKKLAKKIKNNEVILFVGAGISANLGLPTWQEMIDEMADHLGIDKEIFSLYGNSLDLAEYYCLETGGIGRLVEEMKDKWIVEDRRIEKSKIHKDICKLNFQIIYTTNYDNCLEESFELFEYPYTKIVGVQDICNINHNKTQIVKFHGDFSDDKSIILTESSYFERMDFESSMDIKLRSDMLGKSFLFIGYSLSDINMRYLIYKLNKIWSKYDINKKPDSYIFLPNSNFVQEKLMECWGIKSIIGDDISPEKSVENFLDRLVREVKIKDGRD
ncbi:SIR2 family protein [Fusobacterium sp. IOR10]|uniref:SIR2 family protein n=1 Tax=Fusobacterium sp. IOR10 TaxID=2665157 RepID=UPI0013D38867|nr:SIR2 family protein [Fusobacterium sp. IOR10]